MTLLEDFAEATTEFKTELVVALSKAATDMLLTLTPADPDYKKKALFAKACLDSTPESIRFVARAMISQGVTHASGDAVIQTSITNNFDALALLFDPTLEV